MDSLFANASYIGPDFQEQIASLDSGEIESLDLKEELLKKPMKANEILEKLFPLTVNLSQLIETIKNDKRVLKNGLENIFFLYGKDYYLWIAVAYHYEDGWHFGANPVMGNDYMFPIGCKVFSNN